MKIELQIKLWQFRETLKRKRFLEIIRFCMEIIFWQAEIVVCQKILEKYKPLNVKKLEAANDRFKFYHLKSRSEYLQFHQLQSRKLKAKKYFLSHYGCFAIVKDNEIVADLWYLKVLSDKNRADHPHLQCFGFHFEKPYVYMFDMYITEKFRGSGLNNKLFNYAFSILKNEEIEKIYGSYRKSNLPALWMHRVAGYEDLFEIKITRIFCKYWKKMLQGQNDRKQNKILN